MCVCADTGVFGVSQRSDVCVCVQIQVCLVSLRGVVCVCADTGVFGVSQRSDVCVCVCADAGVFGVSEE